MELDDNAKQIVQKLGSAINDAIENSSQVAESIEQLREAGYEMELTLRLEIGLRAHDGRSESLTDTQAQLELTDEDVRTLRRMNIRIDDGA